MKKLLVLGAALAALVAGTDFSPPADAAEMERPETPAAPAAPRFSWTGSQVGLSGGGAKAFQSYVASPYICGVECPVSPFSFSGSPWSATVGAFLGYSWQIGWMVVGIEGDMSAKKLETTYGQSTGPTFLGASVRNESFNASIKQGWDGSGRLRAGYLMTPWTLAYLTGGLAFGEITGFLTYRGTLDVGCPIDSCTATVDSNWAEIRIGWTVGAGLEYALGPFLKARLEYRYTDLGKHSRTLPVSSNCLTGVCSYPTTANVDLQADFHKVTVGIGFDFHIDFEKNAITERRPYGAAEQSKKPEGD
jgi:outer membrane immunogenic protein